MSLVDRDILTVDRRETGASVAVDSLGNPVLHAAPVPQTPRAGIAFALTLTGGPAPTFVLDNTAGTLVFAQGDGSHTFALSDHTIESLVAAINAFNYDSISPLGVFDINAIKVAAETGLSATLLQDASGTLNTSANPYVLNYVPFAFASSGSAAGYPKVVRGHFQMRNIASRDREDGLKAVEYDAMVHSYLWTDGRVNDLVSKTEGEWFRVIDAPTFERVSGRRTALYQLKRVE